VPVSTKTLLVLILTLGGIALLILVLRPDPVEVDVAIARRGPLQVTVDEDGETRAHDRFVISAPMAGRVARIDLHEGDPVEPGQIVAEMFPLPLSAREREEQLAHIAAFEAQQQQREERVRHAESDHTQTQRERNRLETLWRRGIVSEQQVEQARILETTARNELEEARSLVRVAIAEVAAARAALLAIDAGPAAQNPAVPLRAPVAGKVLRIAESSERVVAPGTPLVTLGDPGALEVVVDVLSSEAVKIAPGMPVVLEGWGGDRPLQARVRVVEPYAFTKVSALGVDEQRVNVVADFVDPPGLVGDGYRVDARIVLWNGDDVLKVPASALFRHGEGWSAFVVESGRARRRAVAVGHRGALEIEVAAGLGEGEVVVRHPSNDVDDGVRVRISPAGAAVDEPVSGSR
jgi:HlyD family secretion protein